MQNLGWIENVIEDLTRFARSNELPELASTLEATKQVASREISTKASGKIESIDQAVPGTGGR